jgi:hypothetical protein
MTDNYTDTDDDGDEDFKNLRAKAKKADQFERENQTLKRELAFSRAGIPTDDPKIGYFVKGYEGDLEPDAIRQAAVDAGFITVQKAPADPVVDQAREGQERVFAAGSGTATEFDLGSVEFEMQAALAEGGLDGLSRVAQQYGVTFTPEEI